MSGDTNPNTPSTETAMNRDLKQQQAGEGFCADQESISNFLHAVLEGKIHEAARLLRATDPSKSKQLWPMRIGHLVRYVDDWQNTHSEKLPDVKPWRSQRVAVVGAGTAGLVCAGSLAHQGYPVSLYEAVETPGGAFRFGEAQSEVVQKVLDWELEVLKRIGVEIHCNSVVGEELKLGDLVNRMGFSAVFIAVGKGLAHSLGEGHSLNPLVLEESTDQNEGPRTVLIQESECLSGEAPSCSSTPATSGTTSVAISASVGKNGAAKIHRALAEEDLKEDRINQDWDDFMQWCIETEHTAHE